MASVALQGVCKSFGRGPPVVDQLHLEAAAGELLVLVGPSGSGKTTTLRLIAGLERPDAGAIRIGERVVTDIPARQRDVALVFQNYALYPHLSVYKNLAFGLELRSGWLRRLGGRWFRPSSEVDRVAGRCGIQQQVLEAARQLGIDHLLGRLPRQLSGGERQRVALGRALVRQPAVFLLDEPLSQLDAPMRDELRRELRRLQGRLQATMVYVTHDQVEAMVLGHRIAVLHQGRVQQVGPPCEVYDQPANRFVAGFLGAPPMNFLPGRVVENGGRVGFRSAMGDVAPPEPHAGRLRAWKDSEVVLGVRPECVLFGGAALEPGWEVRLRVESAATLGDATLLEGALPPAGAPPTRWLVKVAGRGGFRQGETLAATVAWRHTYFFAGGEAVNLACAPARTNNVH